MLDQFREWWFSAEQDEMRLNVAEGWAFKVWVASRWETKIEFPNLSDDKFCWADGVFNLKEDISQKLASHGIRIKVGPNEDTQH